MNVISVVVFALILTLAIGNVYFANSDKGLSQNDLNIAVENALLNANTIKDTEISNLQNQINDLTVIEPTEDTSASSSTTSATQTGYIIDGYSINGTVEEDLSDREINLFDGKVEFDDEDYNMDEYVYLSDIKLTVNEEDFNEDVYTVVKEGAIEYKVVFDNDLDTSLITRDNSLVFNFLGEQIEIIDFNDDDVTFKKASEVIIAESDTITIDGTVVLLDMVESDFVYVTVNGDSEKITEFDTKKVGGIEVYVSEILYSSKESRVSKAVLAIGDEVEETIENGEEYAEDSIFNLVFDENFIGLVLNEDFDDDLDEDEDAYKPLGYGDNICLPNDYVCVEFNDLSDEEYSEYNFDYDFDDKETEIRGDFEVGTEDVDTLLINETGMFYEDEEGDLQDASSVIVKLKDSEETISFDKNTSEITIGTEENLVIPMDISKVEIDSNDKVEEGKYRSIYGSVVEINDDLDEDPEDDKELSILVPEEQVELSFLVY